MSDYINMSIEQQLFIKSKLIPFLSGKNGFGDKIRLNNIDYYVTTIVEVLKALIKAKIYPREEKHAKYVISGKTLNQLRKMYIVWNLH